MKIIRDDVKQANAILSEYNGANVRVWSYSKTFNIIELMLDFRDYEYIVFILFTGCTYFKGKLDWSESKLKISENKGITEINDLKAGFQIKAKSGFILKKGLGGDFFDESQLPPIPLLPWEEEGKDEAGENRSPDDTSMP